MSGHLWLITAYGAMALFIAGIARVIIGIVRLPMHLRWELQPVPGEGKKSSYGGSLFEEPEWWTAPRERSIAREALYMLKEVLLLHTVWKRQRRLWPLSFALHAGIYLLFFTVLFLFLSTVLDTLSLRRASALFEGASYATGAPAYALGTIGAAGMLILRTCNRDLRAYSGLPAYLNLAILLALFVSGGAGMLSDTSSIHQIKAFISAALRADPDFELSGAGAVHVAVALVFIAVLPFTSMSHFAAKFFTFHRVLWDDKPSGAGTAREAEALLGQKVTWSAGHIKSDGSKNWIDVARGK